MGKSSAQAPGDTTQRQTNLPEYADPYFRRLLQGAEDTLAPFQDDLSSPIYDDAGNITGFGQKSTYQPYSGERLTSSSDYGDIQASRAMTRGIAQSGIQGMPEAMDAQREGMDLSRFGVGLQDEAANAQRLGMAEAITGAGYTEDSINRLRDIGQYAPGTFSSFDPTQFGGFQSSDFDPYSRFRQANYNEYDFQQPDMFTGQAVQNYMSPYMQNVVDVQKQQAQLDFDRQQAGRDASAVQAGAFGGSRQAVGDYLAQEGLSRQMGDIQASGQQQAYQQAATQFGADRAAQMDMERLRGSELARIQAGRAGELGRVQTGEVGELARIQAGRAAEAGRVQQGQYSDLSRMDALRASELARIQQAMEQSRQFGAGQSLAAEQAAMSGAGQLSTIGQGIGGLGMNIGRTGLNYGQLASNIGAFGQNLAGLGQQQRAADIQGAQLLETIGRDIRAEDQARLDMSYEDFARQRDYPMQQYQRMASILQGVPVTPNVEEQRMVSYNPLQQALGAGISGLGLYKGLTS
jgi:hypothetical protein